MYRIMCFGDSNTWGFKPEDGSRFDSNTRWPCVMHKALGDDVELVEEGMNGRTTVWNDPVDGLMSGLDYLQPCLLSHKPLDLVIIMLGTNDLKDRCNVGAIEIAKSAGRLVRLVHTSDYGPNGSAPKVLLIAPPPIVEGPDGFGIRQHGLKKSQQFAEAFSGIAAEMGCEFFDAGSVIKTSPVDGVHFSAKSHHDLGLAIAEAVRKMNAK